VICDELRILDARGRGRGRELEDQSELGWKGATSKALLCPMLFLLL